jgi:hypothetical protein
MPPPQEAEVRKRHVVVLSEQERARLHTMIGRGVAPASALTHARILLKANQGEAGPGWTDVAIGAALEVNRTPAPRGLLGRCGLDHERADAGLIVTHEHLADKLTAAMDAGLGKD